MISLYQNYTYWQEQHFKEIRECLTMEERIEQVCVEVGVRLD